MYSYPVASRMNSNFLKTFPSGQSQHLSAHVQSCGVSSRTHQPKTFADIAATFVSSHSQSTAGLLINNIPQLLLQVQVQVRPNILLYYLANKRFESLVHQQKEISVFNAVERKKLNKIFSNI